MNKIFVSVLALTVTATTAFATGDSYCHAVDGSGAEFGYGFGRVPGLAIVSATIRADGKHWSMLKTDGVIPVIVAQGAQDGSRTIIDFADPEYSEIIASMRIISAIEGDQYRAVGILRIPNVGVYAMNCE